MGDAPVFFLFLLALPLLLVGAVLFAVFAVLGPLLGFLISLPFRILGCVLALVGLTLGLGGFVLLPLLVFGLPFALVAAGVIWLMRRGDRRTAHA